MTDPIRKLQAERIVGLRFLEEQRERELAAIRAEIAAGCPLRSRRLRDPSGRWAAIVEPGHGQDLVDLAEEAAAVAAALGGTVAVRAPWGVVPVGAADGPQGACRALSRPGTPGGAP